MQECWFDAEAFLSILLWGTVLRAQLHVKVQHGPDDHGVYHVVWADATPSFQEVGSSARAIATYPCHRTVISHTCFGRPADSPEVHGSQLLRLDSNKVHRNFVY